MMKINMADMEKAIRQIGEDEAVNTQPPVDLHVHLTGGGAAVARIADKPSPGLNLKRTGHRYSWFLLAVTAVALSNHLLAGGSVPTTPMLPAMPLFVLFLAAIFLIFAAVKQASP